MSQGRTIQFLVSITVYDDKPRYTETTTEEADALFEWLGDQESTPFDNSWDLVEPA